VTAQLDDVVFGADGLAPIVVQDAETKEVLMLAYGNREAVRRTIESNTTWFWSRSRGEYWNKGTTSGNVQEVVEIRVDCDGDALLVLVDPKGPACHTGEVSCFFRTLPPSR
jgi:phosphoribosyl-ATP pyrophosphohydrolase/phosphoribosyl-AMP cyclohydrolase